MKKRTHFQLWGFRKAVVMAMALILATGCILPVFADAWYCPNCGRYNDSNYCPKDGTKKPTDLSGSSGIRDVRVGDVIFLGTYEQDNQRSREESIEWLVLDVDNNYALLLSRYGLEAGQPFLDHYGPCTWETSTLRAWLNDDFLYGSFTAAERNCIQDTWVDNGKSQGNPNWSTAGGNSTLDSIFLLSYAEATCYFKTNEARRCAPTDYALSQKAWTFDKYSPEGRLSGAWWLRSPGETKNYAACVDISGDARYYNAVGNNYVCVRPAMWVDVGTLPR